MSTFQKNSAAGIFDSILPPAKDNPFLSAAPVSPPPSPPSSAPGAEPAISSPLAAMMAQLAAPSPTAPLSSEPLVATRYAALTPPPPPVRVPSSRVHPPTLAPVARDLVDQTASMPNAPVRPKAPRFYQRSLFATGLMLVAIGIVIGGVAGVAMHGQHQSEADMSRASIAAPVEPKGPAAATAPPPDVVTVSPFVAPGEAPKEQASAPSSAATDESASKKTEKTTHSAWTWKAPSAKPAPAAPPPRASAKPSPPAKPVESVAAKPTPPRVEKPATPTREIAPSEAASVLRAATAETANTL